jgi:hypothetical protein
MLFLLQFIPLTVLTIKVKQTPSESSAFPAQWHPVNAEKKMR